MIMYMKRITREIVKNKYPLIISLMVLLVFELIVVNYSPLDWLGICTAFLGGLFALLFSALIYFAVDEAFTEEIE